MVWRICRPRFQSIWRSRWSISYWQTTVRFHGRWMDRSGRHCEEVRRILSPRKRRRLRLQAGRRDSLRSTVGTGWSPDSFAANRWTVTSICKIDAYESRRDGRTNYRARIHSCELHIVSRAGFYWNSSQCQHAHTSKQRRTSNSGFPEAIS